MKYNGNNFREFYKHIVTIEINDQIREAIKDFKGAKTANCIYAYGYIDEESGFMFEVLASGKQSETSGLFNPREGNDEVSVKLKAEVVEGLEIYFFDEKRTNLRKKFASKIEMIEKYNASDEVELSRSFSFLDEYRHNYLIDVVKVILVKNGNKPEICWVQITGLDESNHIIIGHLLVEPEQNFDYHDGDTVAFFMQQTEDGNVVCVSNMNQTATLTQKDLEDGSMLEAAVHRFHKEQSEQSLFEVYEILRDSFVWVPCNAVMSDADQARFMEMINGIEGDEDAIREALIGKEFVAHDETRLVPDVLASGGDFYFPIFSSEEAMGEYGEGFSHVQRHILDVLPLARNNEHEPVAIVLNAFSESIEIPREFWDVLENMKSRIESENN